MVLTEVKKVMVTVIRDLQWTRGVIGAIKDLRYKLLICVGC
jgi:hypothetical protein